MFKSAAIIVSAMLVLPLVGSPIKDNASARNIANADYEAPVNLWSWPTRALSRDEAGGAKWPATVWNPEVGVWYKSLASNGYAYIGAPDGVTGEFGSDFVTCIYNTGYGWGAFLELGAGHYLLSCNTDGAARFWLAFYGEVEGGFQWVSDMKMSRSSGAGKYEQVFTVPEGTALTALIPVSPLNNTVLTTTNIEIYRLD